MTYQKKNGASSLSTSSDPAKHSNRSQSGFKSNPTDLTFEHLEERLVLTVVINEFLAENIDGLSDAAGHEHDWIELKNTGGSTEDVSGWYLTDDALNLTKFQIPATAATTSLAPGEKLLIFASGDNGEVGVVGNEIHTNFQLSQEAGYLGLIESNGSTISHEFNLYPQQTPDISYGTGVDVASLSTSSETLVGDSSSLTAFVPDSADQNRDDNWREMGYNDAGWLTGTGSVGWDINGTAPDLTPYIGRTLTTSGGGAEVDVNFNYTVYVRYEFDVTDKEQLTSLDMNLRFDDGFIAYLNGREIARANFAEDFVYPQPQWNSYAGHQQGTSSSSGNWNRVSDADQLVSFDLTAYLEFLEDEDNVLAFHGVNSRSSGSGGTNRQDFLIDAELVADRATGSTQVGFLEVPSPGNENGVAYDGVILDTEFSVDRGIFDTAQSVEITALDIAGVVDPTATIRYTLDYSEPTLTNGFTYSSPLSITDTTILRAKAFKTNYISTNVDTQSYIFPADVINQDDSYITQTTEAWGHDKDGNQGSGYNLDYDDMDWEMDPDIVTGNETALINALTDIPTVSIVTDWANLFGGTPLPGTGQTSGRVAYEPEGIYIHGRSSERPNSFEYITADGSIDEQVESVIEIQGHSSPGRWKSDKLSFQIKFKAPYGDPKLNLDIFEGTAAGETAADSFDTLILDAQYNYTWHHANVSVQSDYARFVTDQVTADLQNLASGSGAAAHGRWVHLYLDGIYWGIYDIHERPDENFTTEYFGGQDEDYYVVKHSTNDVDGLKYTWVEGGLAAEDAYNDLLVATRQNMSIDANYEAVEDMLDVEQFIDYMIVHMYAGNENDWPHNNWYATYDTTPDGKWKFHAWDQEHAFPTNDNGDSFTQFVDLTDDDDNETPGEVFANLIDNEEFRLLFSDRVQELMQNGGVLTPTEAAAVYQARVDEITLAILGESARWGDNRDANDPYTQADFLSVANGVINDFFPTRTATVLSQFDSGSNDWLVNDQAPTWNQYGGLFSSGFNLTMANPNGSGTIYYTTDGSDPRDRDTNGVSSSAIAYTGAVSLTESTQIRARVFANSSGTANDWSAEVNKAFTLDEPFSLRIVELMYNPSVSGDLEYIELQNIGTQSIDINGVQITDFSATGYTFDSQILAPGERIVVAENVAAFQAEYPSVTNVASTAYSGGLSNGGETITLLDAFDNVIQSFTYDDVAPWPTAPDDGGPSLVYVGPFDAGEDPLDGSPADPFDDPTNWAASADNGGSPGADEPSGGIPGDLNNDGFVDGLDLGILLGSWGTSTTPENGELNETPPVDGLDLGILLGAWSPPPVVAAATIESESVEQTQQAQVATSQLSSIQIAADQRQYAWIGQSGTPTSEPASQDLVLDEEIVDEVLLDALVESPEEVALLSEAPEDLAIAEEQDAAEADYFAEALDEYLA